MSYFDRTKLTDNSGNVINPASEESLILLRQLLTLLKPLGMVTGSGSNRLSIDVNSQPNNTIASGTVTTVTTVGTVANQTNIGNVNAFSLVKDTARNAYNNGIRSHLSFT